MATVFAAVKITRQVPKASECILEYVLLALLSVADVEKDCQPEKIDELCIEAYVLEIGRLGAACSPVERLSFDFRRCTTLPTDGTGVSDEELLVLSYFASVSRAIMMSNVMCLGAWQEETKTKGSFLPCVVFGHFT